MISTEEVSPVGVQPGASTPTSHRYVLFVDDETAVVSSLRRITRRWAADSGVTVLSANSGEEAIEVLQTHGDAVWVMISDLRMPGMNGADLVHKTQEQFPQIVCIVLTGYSDISDVRRLVRAGIYAYVVKPWDNEDLLAEITRAYEHARIQRENTGYVHMLENELQWAGDLQQKLLDVELPAIPGAEIRVLYKPIPWLSCGGDYYDIIPFGPEACIVLIGDVAGHGMQAAFVTTMLKTMIFRGYIRERVGGHFSPADFLRWLNERILEEFASVPHMILTFSATLIAPLQKTMVTANGGHEAVLIRRGHNVHVVSEHDSVLGVSDQATYRDHTVDLYTGDELLFFTDGLKEDTSSRERLSDGQVAEVLQRHSFRENDDHAMVAELQGYLHREPYPTDDVTMVRVQIM